MKLQIDFTNKTIKLEDNVNFAELVTKLQQMLPDWADYKIMTNTVIQWTNPYYNYIEWRYKPYYSNPIYCSSGSQLTNVNNIGPLTALTVSDVNNTWDKLLKNKPNNVNVEL